MARDPEPQQGTLASPGNGAFRGDGIVNLVDEAIFRRMLAGLPVFLP